MKTICKFCKTEYSIDGGCFGPVRCAVCGYVWNIVRPTRHGAFLTVLAALCAILSASVFAVAVILNHNSDKKMQQPLVVRVSDIRTAPDALGVARFIVTGVVENRSGEIYGAPDLVAISYDARGTIIGRQKFTPQVTLIDVGVSVPFSQILTSPADKVKKITVNFATQGE